MNFPYCTHTAAYCSVFGCFHFVVGVVVVVAVVLNRFVPLNEFHTRHSDFVVEVHFFVGRFFFLLLIFPHFQMNICSGYSAFFPLQYLKMFHLFSFVFRKYPAFFDVIRFDGVSCFFLFIFNFIQIHCGTSDTIKAIKFTIEATQWSYVVVMAIEE